MSQLVKAYLEEVAGGNLPGWDSEEAREYRRYRKAQIWLEVIKESLRTA